MNETRDVLTYLDYQLHYQSHPLNLQILVVNVLMILPCEGNYVKQSLPWCREMVRSDSAINGRRKIIHLAARMPKLFSIIRLAQLRR